MTRYTREHEWVNVQGDIATIGISRYAAEQLGDVVYVDLPEVGRTFKKGDEAAVVESVKAASEVYTPVSGEVVEVNADLDADPGRVSDSAESTGWFFKLRMSDPNEAEALMDESLYKEYVDTL